MENLIGWIILIGVILLLIVLFFTFVPMGLPLLRTVSSC